MALVQLKRNFFYKRLTITNNDFPSKPDVFFGFHANSVIIVNDSDDDNISFSFRTPYLDGELFCYDGPWVVDCLGEDRLYFKVDPTKSVDIRVWAWRA